MRQKTVKKVKKSGAEVRTERFEMMMGSASVVANVPGSYNSIGPKRVEDLDLFQHLQNKSRLREWEKVKRDIEGLAIGETVTVTISREHLSK